MKKVLIIDDEPLVRRSLSRALKQAEFEVLEANDGSAGLILWQKEIPDLVFLDILMPGLTGPQVLKELTEDLKKKSKIILISAYSGDYNLETVKNMGADLFIAKPFENIFDIVAQAKELLTK